MTLMEMLIYELSYIKISKNLEFFENTLDN